MSKKVIIIAAAVFFLLIGIMGAGFFLIWQKMSVTMAQVQQNAGGQHAEEVKPEEPVVIGPTHKMDTLIVNLADQGGKRYLRVTMELELSAPEVQKEIETRLPQLRDTILMILPSKQYADISTTEGKIALRDEIIARMNSILKTGTIATIYFTEFVVQ